MRILRFRLVDFEINSKAVARSNMKKLFTAVMKLAVERFYITLRSRIPVWSGMAQASTLPLLSLARKENLSTGLFNPETVRSRVVADITRRATARLHGRRYRGMDSATFIRQRMRDGEAAGDVDLIIGDGTFDFDYTNEVVQMNVYDPTRWHAINSAATAMKMFLDAFIATLTQDRLRELLTREIKDVRSFLRPSTYFFIEQLPPQ